MDRQIEWHVEGESEQQELPKYFRPQSPRPPAARPESAPRSPRKLPTESRARCDSPITESTLQQSLWEAKRGKCWCGQMPGQDPNGQRKSILLRTRGDG